MLLQLTVGLILVAGMHPQDPSDSARRGRFTNTEQPSAGLPLGARIAFFARRIWVSFVPRPGAAPRVSYDRAAMSRSPSITWIGHATFLVRMDGVTFLTDPMFSDRAAPVSFAGPRRLVPPGVPLDNVPAPYFVLLSHDHYDHADVRTVRRLARRTVCSPIGTGRLGAARGRQRDRARLVAGRAARRRAHRLRAGPALLRALARGPQ